MSSPRLLFRNQSRTLIVCRTSRGTLGKIFGTCDRCLFEQKQVTFQILYNLCIDSSIVLSFNYIEAGLERKGLANDCDAFPVHPKGPSIIHGAGSIAD